MPMRIVAAGTGIEVDDRGLPDGEPLLMIMGLGMQLTGWPEEFVQMLVSRGFRVLRFDNRDVGLSQYFDHLGVPNLAWAGIRHALGLPVRAPYSLAEMAGDALGVLDALGIAQAHVCGVSMGGMIAQHLAARHPQRVKSLTLMMTTTGARDLPQPGLRVRRALLSRPRSAAPDAVAAHLQHVLGVIGSPAYPADAAVLHQRLVTNAQRAWHPAGTARQILAVVADPDRSTLLPRIQARTCIIHGEADPLVPVAAGRDLLARVAGAVGDFIPGMGHDLPAQLLPRFTESIAANAQR
jgi:pimeloyl-ACP methyl ester carboxylesterase